MATESSVGLPPDSTGKKLRTTEVTTTAGLVEQQAVNIADPTTIANVLAILADGSLMARLKDGAGNNLTSTLLQGRQGLDVIHQGTPDIVGTGTITAVDAVVAAPAGTGVLLSGASTANSYVFAMCPGGDSAWNVQLTGTFGGTTVYFEESLDSTTGVDGNWIAVNGRQTGVVNTVLANGVTTAGVFRGNTSGAKYFRVRAVGGAAPNVAVVIRMSTGVGAVFLNAGLPAGQDAIGSVSLNSAAGAALTTRPDAELRVAMDPSSLLLDTFETLDTTNTWTISGTVVPTGAAGALTVSAGTAASATSVIRSQTAFTNGANAYLNYVSAWVLDAAAVTGNKRVFGLGVPAAAPTTAVPLTNGAVFEVSDSTGALFAVIYSNSVRTQSVALTRPTDGGAHRYSIYFRASVCYFEIDSVTVATITLPNPQVDALPAVAVSVNAGVGMPATAAQLVGAVIGVGDTGRNNQQISDGTYPWRKLTVDATGSIYSRLRDGGGNGVTSTAVGGARPLDVNLAGSAGAIAQTAGTLNAAVANNPGVATTVSTTAQVIANVAQAGNVTFHLVTSAFVGTLIFEASVDAGLNYSPVYCIREDGSGSETGTALSVAAAFIRQYSAALPGLTYFRVRCAAYTSGSVAVVLAPGPFLAEPNPSLAASAALIGQVAPVDGQKATFVAVQQGLGANLASDIVALRGSATRTVRVTRVEVSILQGGTVTAAQTSFTLVKRTAANTGGTTVNTPIQAMDTLDTVTATCVGYTAAATGLGAGNPIRRQNYAQTATAAGVAPPTYTWDFGNRPEKAPVLRGVNEQLAINNAAVAAGTSPTLAWTVTIEWTEE